MTGFDSKVIREDPEPYHIHFYTDDQSCYESVQRVCRAMIDYKDQQNGQQMSLGNRIKIRDLHKKKPLFREFCRVKNLYEGDSYRMLDYILWAESLSLAQQLEIAGRYPPQQRDEEDDRESSGMLE